MVSNYQHKNPQQIEINHLLLDYYENKRMAKRRENELLFQQNKGRDGAYRHSGISNPTMLKAMALLEDKRLQELNKKIRAVDTLLLWVDQQNGRRRSHMRAILYYKYFHGPRSVAQTAACCGIGEGRCRSLNKELRQKLSSIYYA